MIKSITVTNHRSESVVFELRSPELSGFFIRKVDGLGPVKATINTTESLSLDGATFNSSRLGLRNILFDIGFLEFPTIEDTRQKSYKYFPLKREIEVTVETDNRTTKTRGYVESNEPNIFSKEESSIVSVVCPDPYFYSLENSIVEFTNVLSAFSFPFSNESLTEKMILFGNVLIDPQKTITYLGDAPVGIIMNIFATGPVGTFTVHNLETKESMQIDSDILAALTGSGLVDGDKVTISTIKGSKYVLLERDGETINILNALGPESIWFTLVKGDNIFYYTADSGENNLRFVIEFRIVYEGI